ncbi:hypothetical protein [Jiangella alba]|uniref:hypothetical protein n=1 Tax=Jiangella alba TaxID=561176 RepID=UPI00115F9914|nr:hypothetical protein [Jiangella alba]
MRPRDVGAGLVAGAAALLTMAGVAAAGLFLLDAGRIGEVGALTAAVVGLAAGGRATLTTTAPGEFPIPLRAGVEVLPLGVTIAGAVVLGVLVLRRGRDGFGVRGVSATVAVAAGLLAVAQLASGNVTVSLPADATTAANSPVPTGVVKGDGAPTRAGGLATATGHTPAEGRLTNAAPTKAGGLAAAAGTTPTGGRLADAASAGAGGVDAAAGTAPADGCLDGGGVPFGEGGSAGPLDVGYSIAGGRVAVTGAAGAAAVVGVGWLVLRFGGSTRRTRAGWWAVAGAAVVGTGMAAAGGREAAGGLLLMLPLAVAGALPAGLGVPVTVRADGVLGCALDGAAPMVSTTPLRWVSGTALLALGVLVAATARRQGGRSHQQPHSRTWRGAPTMRRGPHHQPHSEARPGPPTKRRGPHHQPHSDTRRAAPTKRRGPHHQPHSEAWRGLLVVGGMGVATGAGLAVMAMLTTVNVDVGVGGLDLLDAALGADPPAALATGALVGAAAGAAGVAVVRAAGALPSLPWRSWKDRARP